MLGPPERGTRPGSQEEASWGGRGVGYAALVVTQEEATSEWPRPRLLAASCWQRGPGPTHCPLDFGGLTSLEEGLLSWNVGSISAP